MNNILEEVKKTKLSSQKISNITTDQKNNILEIISEELIKLTDNILQQNKIDVENAIKENLSKALIDRLTLTEKRIKDMSFAIKEIINLDDPVGEIISEWTRPIGIKIRKVRVPLGVILIIYEGRPNVTVEAASLCLKSGNAVILRGSKETINTNCILTDILKKAISKIGLPQETVLFINSTDRKIIYQLLEFDKYIDLVIPRGGEEMVRNIRKKSIIPVLSHGKGLCHTYIDEFADIDMAIKISYNAKVQRPGVCNAMETLLVHKNIANNLLPQLACLYKKSNVELRGCKNTLKILPDIKQATEDDWNTEYLDLILSIKIVNNIDEAIQHINTYGSGHSEAIVTENIDNANKFLREVDAGAVFHNASTRLHDGGVFGLGSEIGISTQKLHARGTMGLKELTTTKYLIYGSGQIRE